MILTLIHWLTAAWQAILTNVDWMSWNLFLALIPLALSFWLFNPHGLSKIAIKRQPLLFWGVGFLMAVSVFPHIFRMLRFVRNITQILDWKYLVVVILITTALVIVEFWHSRTQHTQSSTRSLGWWIVFLMFIFFLPNAPYVLTDVIHLVEDIRLGYSIWIISLVLIPQYIVFMVLGFGAYILCLIQLERYCQAQGWGVWNKAIELIVQFLCAIGIYLGRFQRFNTWDIITRPDALVDSVVQDVLNQRPLMIIGVTFVVLCLLYALLKPVTLAVLSADYEPSQI